MALEGVMPEETTSGFGNMADFVVAGKGPADAEGHVHIGSGYYWYLKVIAGSSCQELGY